MKLIILAKMMTPIIILIINKINKGSFNDVNLFNNFYIIQKPYNYIIISYKKVISKKTLYD